MIPSIWIENYQVNLRPQIQVRKKRVLHNYCDELLDLLDKVKDNPLQTLKLVLEFEKKELQF